MKQPGFILLELLVSMLIASLLAAALFAAFAQTNRAVRTIDNIVDISYKETVAINQLTKDISGAFIPTQGRRVKPPSSANPGSQTRLATAGGEKKESQSKDKKEKKRLTKIFYGTTKDEQLNVLTCITNNSTLEYPLGVVRVVYRLAPEERFNAKKPAYVLLRQESGSKLEFDDFSLEKKENGVRSYELIGNIKKLGVAYTAVINKPSSANPGSQTRLATAGTPAAQSVDREYKVLNEWVMEDEQDKQFKDYTKIPYAVDVDLVLWDEHREREKKVSFKIMLFNEVVEYEEQTQKQVQQQTPASQQSPQKQTQQPGMQVPKPKAPGQKTVHKAKGSALDQTFSALKTMLLAEGAVLPGGAA